MSKWNDSRIKKKLSSVYEYESPEQFFGSHLDDKVDTSIVNYCFVAASSITKVSAYTYFLQMPYNQSQIRFSYMQQ